MLKSLKVHDWNQFEKIDIDFDKNITIITGVNGSGKSSIIRLLSKLIGWDHKEIMNKFNKKKSKNNNMTTVYNLQDIVRKEVSNAIQNKNVMESEAFDQVEVKGNIETTHNTYKLAIGEETPIDDDLLYEITIQPVEQTDDELIDEYSGVQLFENGINIPAHRMPYFYNPTEYIKARKLERNEYYNHYKYELMRRQVTGYYYDSDDQPQQYIKSSLITLAMYSGDNANLEDSKNTENHFKDFVKVLKEILPKTLKFEGLKIIDGEVVLETKTGNFLIDAVSGGIGALIDLAWQIFMGKPKEDTDAFFVLIDEIENHLHPSMQRSILPDLVKAFPYVQFIVTTHSPFVINSVENAKVIALKYNEVNKVVCNELNLTTEYSSAMEVLREILDVPVLMPIWLEKKIEKILDKYKTNLKPDTYELLKSDLEKHGLEDFMTYTIERLSEEVNNDSIV